MEDTLSWGFGVPTSDPTIPMLFVSCFDYTWFLIHQLGLNAQNYQKRVRSDYMMSSSSRKFNMSMNISAHVFLIIRAKLLSESFDFTFRCRLALATLNSPSWIFWQFHKCRPRPCVATVHYTWILLISRYLTSIFRLNGAHIYVGHCAW